MDNNAIEVAISALLGKRSSHGYLERYASLMNCLDQREALIALDYDESNSWHAEQYVAALKYLSPSPGLKARARGIVRRNCAKSILANQAAKFPSPDQKYIYSYGEGLIEWALFDAPSIRKGVESAISHDKMMPELRWTLFMQLIIGDLWQLKRLLPYLYSEPTFLPLRARIWAAVYTFVTDFSNHHPSLRALEKPIGTSGSSSARMQMTTAGNPLKLRVAIWSRKLATYSSSMTTVFPWLKHLPSDDLEVFLLSDKLVEFDKLQNEYRSEYGPNFIDCQGLSDEEFSTLARSLNLDVIIPIHTSRPLLSTTRLARVHLDVFAQLDTEGIPDQTVISQSMICDEFMEMTTRRFIAIPDPMLVFSTLPDVEITDRKIDSPFCFGVFSRFAKVDSETFDVWAQILRECPLSNLEISSFSANELTYYTARAEFASRNIEPTRITVNKSTSDHVGHLQRYNRVDLMIDTFPMGGAVSAVDSLYMGVPVISLNKDSRPGTKVLKSIFEVLDPEAGSIASSELEYIEYAKRCYLSGPRSKAQRNNLRSLTIKSCLFDQSRYANLMRAVIRAVVENPTLQVTYLEPRSDGGLISP